MKLAIVCTALIVICYLDAAIGARPYYQPSQKNIDNYQDEDGIAEEQQDFAGQQQTQQQEIFKAGKIYALMASNGKFVSRINRGDINYMEAEKTTIDVASRLAVSNLYNGKVSFRANAGAHNYLSRIFRGSVSNIEAAKTAIDVASEFEVEVDGEGYVYLKANNGMYIGVRDRSGRNNVEATFDSMSDATRFVALELL